MECSSATPPLSDNTWHARDGVQFYDGVMLPADPGKLALTGIQTQLPLLPEITALNNYP